MERKAPVSWPKQPAKLVKHCFVEFLAFYPYSTRFDLAQPQQDHVLVVERRDARHNNMQPGTTIRKGITMLAAHSGKTQLPVLRKGCVNSNRRVPCITVTYRSVKSTESYQGCLRSSTHLAQCECPDKCQMLRRLREDIAELRTMLSRSPPKQCREQRRSHLFSKESR
jgi:hypothetical protein